MRFVYVGQSSAHAMCQRKEKSVAWQRIGTRVADCDKPFKTCLILFTFIRLTRLQSDLLVASASVIAM